MSDSASPRRGFFAAFTDLLGLPKAFWSVNFTYALDGFAYFGVLMLLPPFLVRGLGLSDALATNLTGAFAMLVTLFMFGFGSYSERFGVRRALIGSFVILVLGRALLACAVLPSSAALGVTVVVGALFLMAIGEGVVQVANYSGLKQYSDERTSAMGFGFNYALYNLGIMVVGFASSWLRVAVDDILAGRKAGKPLPASWLDPVATATGDGMVAVFWLCAAVTALGVLLAVVTFTRRAEARKLRPEDEVRIRAQRAEESKLPWRQRLAASPFGNARFTFFVFILFPARTLFAHQIHTIGLYILRAYPKEVGDKMEWFGNVVNPLVVFVTVPIIAAVTRHMNMYKLMLVGTLVTALPTFLLVLPERWETLLAYLIIFSLGEALWQPRFYEFAADLAPEGKMGEYMAAANLPWLLAKWTTGWYAGFMLSAFCPETGPRRPGVMWTVYGLFALVSPVGLWLARNWLNAKPEAAKKRA